MRHWIEEFRNILGWCEIEDMGFQGSIFTWSNKRDDFWHSDHRPLLVEILDLEASRIKGVACRKKRFYFESYPANRDDYKLLVSQSWIHTADVCVMGRVEANISNCTHQLSKWNSRNKLGLQNDINKLQRELNLLNSSIQGGSWADIRRVERLLDNNLIEEEEYYR
ncbi:hypothetical protein Ddye_007055 [Dipteronia dyeriana]|uniref:Uncharacterized protein n=1 Tax=Dipteronia dyeriana TaxID=168575 RepID=A0AAE0CR95_9ROSI|nr:hypothetical protein Ddye_007055 [Dipteronia dyeriana]